MKPTSGSGRIRFWEVEISSSDKSSMLKQRTFVGGVFLLCQNIQRSALHLVKNVVSNKIVYLACTKE